MTSEPIKSDIQEEVQKRLDNLAWIEAIIGGTLIVTPKNNFIIKIIYYQNLKKQWVPTWVVKDNDKKSGNQEIVNAGADWISQDISQISFKKIFSSATRQGNFDF